MEAGEERPRGQGSFSEERGWGGAERGSMDAKLVKSRVAVSPFTGTQGNRTGDQGPLLAKTGPGPACDPGLSEFSPSPGPPSGPSRQR